MICEDDFLNEFCSLNNCFYSVATFYTNPIGMKYRERERERGGAVEMDKKRTRK